VSDLAGRVLDDTLAIARIPAPTGEEGDRIEWLERRLAGCGGDRRTDGAGNLVWSLGRPPYDVMLLTHVDTVFDRDVDHEPRLRGGWLCGPGVGDNSVAVATTVNVVESLARDERSLAAVFTVGEEGLGSLRGSRHACATLDAAAVVALEGHGLDSVFVDAVGCIRATLTLSGPGGHSWWDRGRASATHDLVHLLKDLLAQRSPELAVNVGALHGGTSVNAIAVEASATLEARSLDEAALDAFASTLRAVAGELDCDARVELLDRRPSGRLPASHPLTAAVLDVRRSLGLAANLTSGSTDANAALAAGVPALSLGCTRGRDMHSLQERIDVASIPTGAAQLTGVLHRLLDRPIRATPTHLEDAS